MKKILLFFIIIAIASFGACSEKVPQDKLKVDLYFSNNAKDMLVTETAYVDKAKRDNTIEFVKEIVNLLISGPSGDKATGVIPDGTLLRGVSLGRESGTVNIDLSKEYYKNRSKDAPASEELLARYSIVYTLCQFDEIQKVKIYIDGKDMMASTGKDQVLPSFGTEGIMINSPSSTETKTEKFVTLYFTDKKGVNLYPETHKATMTDNSIEKTIVNELIRGPVSGKKYQRTFSDSTNLISVETKEGVCFVNFSDGFLSGIEGDLTAERTAVYSVVNSLTRIPDIKKVQILIDGKKPESDTHQIFSIPLERDESMIVK